MGSAETLIQTSLLGEAVDTSPALVFVADEAMRSALRIITDHRDKLDALASALLRNEVLERRDIDRIMAGVPRFYRMPGHGLRVVAAGSTDIR